VTLMGTNRSSTSGRLVDETGQRPAQVKAALVLAVLSRQASVAQTAAAAAVGEAELGEWLRLFVEAGNDGLRRGARPPGGSRDLGAPAELSRADLADERRVLLAMLHETQGQAQSWRWSAQGCLGPFRELETIRADTATPVSRFSALVGIPRRSYFRRLALLRTGENAARRRGTVTQLCAQVVAPYITSWPEYGHRKIHALMIGDGHVTSQSTVLRTMRLLRRSEHRVDGEPSESDRWRNG
jgi:hypothetical protein